jgi:hypothetical protein
MSSVIHDSDPVANISQEYIEHLREAKKNAANALSTAETGLNAAKNALKEAQGWKDRIHEYWERVQKTEDQYKKIDRLISAFAETAGVVTDNADCVAEAVEVMVCMAREVAQHTDKLKKDLLDIIDKVSEADKSNPLLASMEELRSAIEEAIRTNSAAIKACLDVLKAAYLLHIQLMGKKRIEGLRFELVEKYRKVIVMGDEKDILWYFEKNRGVDSNLDNLRAIFETGAAYRVREKDSMFCPPPEDDIDVICFPLENSPDGYFKTTKEQNRAAKNWLEDAENKERIKQINYNRKKATYDGYDKALQAAENAKNQTK